MTFLQIESFIAVAEHKGFSNAAKQLFLSQPTLTQHISSLEKELGFKLFFRTYRTIQLTEEGKIMYDAFREIKDLFDTSYYMARQIAEKDEKSLSVGLLIMADLREEAQKLNEYCSRKEGSSIRFCHLNIESIGQRLQNGTLDFAFVLDDLAVAISNIESKEVFESEYKIVLPANDELAKKEDFSIKDLEGKEFIVADQPLKPALEEQIKVFTQVGLINHEPCQIQPDLETAYTIVASGRGFSFGTDHNTVLGTDRFCLKPTGVFHKMCVVWNPEKVSKFAKDVLHDIFGVEVNKESYIEPSKIGGSNYV